jgi:hypothetical protein
MPAGKSEEEYLEVKGQQAAYAYLGQSVQGKFRMSEKLIREFHHLLTDRLDQEKYRPGQYKDRDNQVRLRDGGVFPYVSHVDTPSAMTSLVDWYNGQGQSLHPIERAAWLHYKFILIHPFRDGNGRTARLLVNFSLMQSGYILTVFRAEERRRNYLDALRAVDLSVPPAELSHDNSELNLYPLVSHLEQELLWSYDQALDVIEGKTLLTSEDLVRRFQRLDQMALSATGIAADQTARWEILAESVRKLTERVGQQVSTTCSELNRTWTELFLKSGSDVGGAADIVNQERRRTFSLGDSPLRGRAGVVWVVVRRRNGSHAQLFVPSNTFELLIYSEPHALTLGSAWDLAREGSQLPQTDSMHVSLDPASWRAHEIERFVVNQFGRFLTATEAEVRRKNGGS